LFNPAVLHIHDVCFLAERNAVCKVSDWHSLNASNDYVPDYNTLQVTIDHAVFQTAEIPVSEQVRDLVPSIQINSNALFED